MPNKKAKGKRAKTRRKLRNRKPKPSVNRLLAELPTGTAVQISINSSVHSGIPHHRWQGKTGTVTGKRGLAFEVDVAERKQHRTLVVGSAHLNTLKQAGN